MGEHGKQREDHHEEGEEKERDEAREDPSAQKENKIGNNVNEGNAMCRICDGTRRVLGEAVEGIENMLLVCFRGRVGFRRKHLLIVQLIGIIHNIGSTGIGYFLIECCTKVIHAYPTTS